MGKGLLVQGGGGGTSSDDLTAKKMQVLEGYTAVTNDSDDEAIEGGMKNLTDRSEVTHATDNNTKVVLGDCFFMGDNSDGIKRLSVRYNGDPGYIYKNTLIGYDANDLGSAKQSNVLNGIRFTSSNGLNISGSMPDNSTRTSNGAIPGISTSFPNIPTREADSLQMNKDTSGKSRISMCPPKGYYPGDGSSYVNRPASDFGLASKADVLSGKTFTSTDGVCVSGTMLNCGTNQYGGFGEGGDYYAINGLPEGYYCSSGNSWAPEARCLKTTVRNYLGVKAEYIRSGKSIAGISGTLSYTSAINFSAAAISDEKIRISWNNPSKGPWTGIFIQISTSGYPGTGGGTRAYTGSGWGNSSTSGAWNYVDISGLSSQTTYYFTCTSYSHYTIGTISNDDWGTSYNVSATTHSSIQDIFNKTSTEALQYWARYSSSSNATYSLVNVSFSKNKVTFFNSKSYSMGDNMKDFAEGDGLNLFYIEYDSLNQDKIKILHQYNVKFYIDSTNELKYTWNSGGWKICGRRYMSKSQTQISLPGLNGLINGIGSGSASNDNAKIFRLEFIK